jgi:hypothetical protein
MGTEEFFLGNYMSLRNRNIESMSRLNGLIK